MEPQDKKLENKSNIILKKRKYIVLQKIKAVNEANKYFIHFVDAKYNIDKASIPLFVIGKSNLNNYKIFLIKIIIEFQVVELNL